VQLRTVSPAVTTVPASSNVTIQQYLNDKDAKGTKNDKILKPKEDASGVNEEGTFKV